MALRKQIIEMPAMDGLQQKTASQRLQPGKSAKAVNLQKNKQGRLEKRLGLIPLSGVDPYGSGFSLSRGLQLGTWNNGVQDTLLAMGSGTRPGTSATAAALQAYSDDLGGPVLKGPVPELSVVSDSTIAGAPGTVTSPMCAVSGDYMMTAWIDATSLTVQVPQPSNGQLWWMVTQLSTGQIVVPPNLVDATSATGSLIQCARLEIAGNGTFVIAYSRGPTGTPDLNIYGRKLTASTLNGGSSLPTWSPAPTSAPTVLANNNVSQNGAFDMRADTTAGANVFVLAFESGSWTMGGGYSPTSVIVQSYVASILASAFTWTVQSASYQAAAYGLRIVPSGGTPVVAVCYALPSASYTYQVLAAIGTYPGLVQYNAPTIIYTPTSANESPPFFLDVSECPGGVGGHLNFVESHSPSGAVWNACNLPANASEVAGFGATATCGLEGQVQYVILKSGGIYQSVRATGANVSMVVTDANGNQGPIWDLNNLSYTGPQLYDNTNSSSIIALDQPSIFSPGTGTAASISFSSGSNIVTVTGMSGLVSAQVGFPITITNSGTSGNNGTFTIATVVSSSSVTFFNASGATDAGGAVHWSVPDPRNGSAALVYPLKATFSGGVGIIEPAVVTATMTGGINQSLFTLSSGGQGYSSGTPPTITITPVLNTGGSGATATATVNVGGQVTGWTVSAAGSGYTQPPILTFGYSSSTVATMTQSTQCRLIGTGTTTLHTENNARIIQNMFFVNPLGSPGSVRRYNPTDGFGYCCGDATAPGSSSYQTHGVSCLTPGLTLASRGLEANGIVYYLGWVPSLTQGSFIVLAFDLAQNPITTGSGVLTGNGYPMRPVATLQTRTALSDPGGGLQSSSTGFVRPSTTGPNMWTGASSWFLGSDNYKTAYVAYVSSSLTDRLSLATGAIKTAPAQGPQMAAWGNLTAIGGALPCVYDGQNVTEQSFLWSPDAAVCFGTKGTFATNQGSNIDFLSATDSYSYIFTWEQFDAQGNLHISARSTPITITGQNLIDTCGETTQTLSAGVSYLFTFIVPSLGATLRQWPTLTTGQGPPGNDIRSYCIPPSGAVTLGVYRTQKNSSTYYRIYDRGFNGIDGGGESFTLPGLVGNNFVSTLSNAAASNLVGTVFIEDGLNDSVITRINASSALPFPLLYTDGSNGNPGSLDGFCPPNSNITCRHKERLFIANGNLVMFTKQRSELVGPGYNETVNSIFVGGDDLITGLASMDDKLVIFKQDQIYYVSGDGPADDGTGSNFSDPQAIPTDAGCIDTGSIIPTPEGIYFMSDAGLRLVTRSLAVEYVGGPVEDELSTYSVITGAVLYPSNNKVIFLANQSDYNGGSALVGEVLVRDYVLDAWTTTQYLNGANGFLSSAVAYANGSAGNWSTAPGLAWHVLSANGTVYREKNPSQSGGAYASWQDGLPASLTYVQSTWLSAPIKMQDLARFRAWDFQVWGVSADPHGLTVSTAIDYGSPGLSKSYSWATIAPGGSTPIPLTQIRSYDGRMGESFQVQVQDVSDASSSTGQGFQVLGLSVTTGAYPSQYKLFPGSTK